MSRPSPSTENQNPTQGLTEGEISLVDILLFFKGAYRTIAITSFLGFIISITYLALTPKEYEATAQIRMAQIDVVNSSNNNYSNSLNPLGVNIEEPSQLIARFSQPTSFTPEVLSACNVADATNPGVRLFQVIKLTQPKGLTSTIELKTLASSPMLARSCALAIFELMKATQAEIMTPYIEAAKIRLADDERRLENARELVARANKSGQAMSAAYLSTRDEIRFLLDEITMLNSFVINNQSRATRLIAPIYASDVPIAPKKRKVIVCGILGGLFLGLFLALVRQKVANMKNDMDGFQS